MELLDFSCADEVVAKLLLWRRPRGPVRGAAGAARGPARGHRARAHPPPARRRGVLAAGMPRRRGCWAGSRPTPATAFACICERGPRSTAVELAARARRGPVKRAAAARGARACTGWSARTASGTYPAHHRMSRAPARAAPPRPSTASPIAGRTGRRSRPPCMQSSTFVSPVGSRRGDPLQPVRQQSQPGRARPGSTPCSKGAEDAIFVASGMGGHRAGAPGGAAPRRPPGQQQLDLRRHPAAVRRGAGPLRHRHHLRAARTSPRLWRKSVRKATRAIFVETPTNPLMRVLDLAPIAHVAKEFGLALLVDATFASPINFRPLEHGADVVITSATKYLNGHSDVIAGAVAGSASFVEEVTRLMRLWGQAIDPHAAWLMDRGMRTLASAWSATTPTAWPSRSGRRSSRRSRRCTIPGSQSHPDHALREGGARRLRRHGGPRAAGGAKAAERMLRRLKLVTHAPSLAGVETPGVRAAPHLAPGIGAEDRAALGIPGWIPAAELRHRGCGRHHRRPGAGAGANGLTSSFHP